MEGDGEFSERRSTKMGIAMIYEELKRINEGLRTIDIERKDKNGNKTVKKYSMVVDRVDGFRQLFTNGCITTEIVAMDESSVVMKATIRDEEGNILATGLAREEKDSSYINKTSFIENCETSAVGRALGFLGIGVDESMASAEEVANAMTQQANEKRDASDVERNIFEEYCSRLNVKPQDILRKCGWKSGKMTVEHYGKALVILKEMDESNG